MTRLWHLLAASAVAVLAFSAQADAAAYPKESTPSIVATTGPTGGLTANGAAYQIKGIAYSPVSVGENVNFAPHGDYFTPDYAYIWARDLPAIKDAGFNTLRIYAWNNTVNHSLFLDALHSFGLKAILTFYVDPVAQAATFGPTEQEAVITKYKNSVALYGDHPAILLWAFGNELNGPWNGIVQKFDIDTSNGASVCNWQTSGMFGTSCFNTSPDAADGSPCFIATTCMYTKFFGWLNKAAVAAKAFTTRPQTSTFADVDHLMTSAPTTDRLKRFASLLTDMDVITVQLYRGASFGSYFADYRTQTSKPLLIGEYGADAYNDPCGWDSSELCQNYLGQSGAKGGSDVATFGGGCGSGTCDVAGVVAQSSFDKGLTDALVSEGQVIGGILMEWHDENWKNAAMDTPGVCTLPCGVADGSTVASAATAIEACYANTAAFSSGGTAGCKHKAHITCSNYNAGYHDLCGYPLQAAPDGYVNEAWFGVNGVEDCGSSFADADGGHRLSALSPRPVLAALKGSATAVAKSCLDMNACYTCVRNAWGTIENARAHIAPGVAQGDCNAPCGFNFSQSSTSVSGGSGGNNQLGGSTGTTQQSEGSTATNNQPPPAGQTGAINTAERIPLIAFPLAVVLALAGTLVL